MKKATGWWFRMPVMVAAIVVVALWGLSLATVAFGGDSVTLSVKLVNGLTPAQQAAVIARDGGVEKSVIAPLRLHVVTVPTANLPLILADYQKDPQVESVEVSKSRKAETLANDQHVGVQWALTKIGWDQVYGTTVPAGSATVALLDTGIDAGHPDLTGNVIAGTSILDGSTGLTDPSGHGTQMAGIVAAVTGNSQGIAGVAFGGVKLMPVTVLNAAGVGQDSDIIAGVVWAADHGANVILMAFSNPDFSRHLQDAIDYAWAKGCVLVAATGNGGSSVATFPAGDKGVIGISATDENDLLAATSNYGADTFLAAPGTNIYTTTLGGAYTYVSGTSASAAITAGVAAFLKANDATLANGVILARLAAGADAINPGDPDKTQKYGYGRVSMAKTLSSTVTAPIEPVGAAKADTGSVGPYTAAAIALRGINYSGGLNANATIAIPPGVAADDVMILVISQYGSATAPTAPNGWTAINTPRCGTAPVNSCAAAYYRRAGASEGNISTTLGTGTTNWFSGVAAFTGVDRATALDATPGSWTYVTNANALTNITATTTTMANAVVVMLNASSNASSVNEHWFGQAVTSPTLNQVIDWPATDGGVTSISIAWGTKTTPDTTGTGSATIQSTNGALYGVLLALRPAFAVPTLTTPTATAITTTAATLGANVTDDGFRTITARGTCWGTAAAPAGNCSTVSGTTGVFTGSSFGTMTAGTLIYYRGYATNAIGHAYSSDGSFYTEPATQASNVTFTPVSQNSMTVNWTRCSGDGVIVLMRAANSTITDPTDGTYTGYTANAAYGSGTQIGGTGYVIYKGAGSSVTVTGLTVGTTYYVAVYEYKGTVDTSGTAQGTNYKGTPVNGNQAPATAPTLTTPTATAITTTSATLGANVTGDGGATIIARGTCWGTAAAPTGNCSTVSGTTGVFTGSSSGTMTAGTLIYYRGYATNSIGTGYSADGTITTATTLTVTGPAGVTYPNTGTITTNSGGSGGGALSYSGSGGCTVDSGTGVITITNASAGPCAVTATRAAGGAYAPQTSVSANVALTGRAVTLSGTRAYDTTATAAAGILAITNIVASDAVNLASGSATLAGSGAGAQAISAMNTLALGGAAAGNYTLTGGSGTVTITAAGQTITFNALGGKTFGDADVAVSATASSGLTVAFTSQTTGVCTATGTNGATIHIVAAGDCTIRASQPGNSNYTAASDVDRTFTVAKATATCTVTPYSVTYDATAHTATGACTGVGGVTLTGLDLSNTTHTAAGTYASDPWSFTDVTGNYQNASGTVSDAIAKAAATCTVTGWTGTYDATAHGASGSCTGIGNVTLTGLSLGSSFTTVPGGTANWTFTNANYADQSGSVGIVINKAAPSCSVTPYSVTYDATAHGATGSCTGVAGATLTGLTLGSSFTAVPGGTANWSFTNTNYADQSGNVGIVISQAASLTSVTVAGGSAFTYDGLAHPATVVVTGAGGLNLTPAPVYSCGHPPTGAADSGCTASYTFVGDTNHTGSSDSATYTISKATQTLLAMTGPVSVTYGSTGALAAAGGSGSGAVSYDLGSSTGCAIIGGTVYVRAVGASCAITAIKAGDSNYNAATSVSLAVTLAKGTASVSLSNLTQYQTGGPLTPTAVTTPPGLAVTWTGAPQSAAGSYTVTAGGSGSATIQLGGVGSSPGACTVTYSQAGDGTYNPVSAQETLYQLTTSAGSGGGTVIPASGSWYSAGAAPSVTATASAGNAFTAWNHTGGLIFNENSASTTITMSAPSSMTATWRTVSTTLSAAVTTGVSGVIGGDRVWNVVLKSGVAPAGDARLLGVNLSSSGLCRPVATSGLPATVGPLGPNSQSGALPVHILFTRCTAGQKFNAVVTYSADGGATTGTVNFTGLTQ